jgi:hypothetical protein
MNFSKVGEVEVATGKNFKYERIDQLHVFSQSGVLGSRRKIRSTIKHLSRMGEIVVSRGAKTESIGY